jgi:thioredoxin-related protein
MGVNAFPFWLVTDGDGTVLFRSAGYLDNEQLIGLMGSLSEYSA